MVLLIYFYDIYFHVLYFFKLLLKLSVSPDFKTFSQYRYNLQDVFFMLLL